MLVLLSFFLRKIANPSTKIENWRKRWIFIKKEIFHNQFVYVDE